MSAQDAGMEAACFLKFVVEKLKEEEEPEEEEEGQVAYIHGSVTHRGPPWDVMQKCTFTTIYFCTLIPC
jgi:hypothetical protein